MREFKVLAVILGLALLAPAAPACAANPDSPAGRWLTASGNAVVQVSTCGPDICGQIVGLVLRPGEPMPTDWTGGPQCGFTIFRLAPRTDDAGQPLWTGSIFDPRDGAHYQAQVAVKQPGRLQLRGYIGLPIFGRTQIWTPYAGAVPADCRLRH